MVLIRLFGGPPFSEAERTSLGCQVASGMLPPLQSPFVTFFQVHRPSYPHSRLFLTLFKVSVKQETIAGEEGSMDLFGSRMEKNNDHTFLFWGTGESPFSFHQLPSPHYSDCSPRPQCKANGSGYWVRLVLSWDCLGVLLRRERTRLLCLESSQHPRHAGAPGSRALEEQESGDLRSVAALPCPPCA